MHAAVQWLVETIGAMGYPGIFVLANGNPQVTNSTIQ